MSPERGFAERHELAGVVRAAFGPRRRLAAADRLRGGSKKGVYRLTLDDRATVICYVWDAAENYWPDRPSEAEDHDDPFSDASGLDLFEASHAQLDALGIRTPRIYAADHSRAAYPADVALVEDVRGENLEARLDRGLPGTEHILARLGAALAVLHQYRGPSIGKVAAAGRGSTGRDRPCEQIVLDRALDDLEQAAARVERVAAARAPLEAAARQLAAAVRPRSRYGLIHGELGPDHVLIDGHGQPVLIDTEGVMFFDIEWEHAFLELRFGEHYRWLREDGLDPERLRLYRLALHLSLIAGPLRLLDGDFPDRAPMLQIAQYNTARALAFLRQAGPLLDGD